MKILTNQCGCDFLVCYPQKKSLRLLQLTDMQMIDATQRRTPDRLRPDEIEAWQPERMDALVGNAIRSLIAQTCPDFIFITGDIVYGSFDDSGKTLLWFIDLMDSFQIPWAPVFGNHDNESKMGVAWQCEQLEKSPYCVFRRGQVTGNSNYSVGLMAGEELVRVLHMMDSNGCGDTTDPAVMRAPGFAPDQLERLETVTQAIAAHVGDVPAFAAFHIPTEEFLDAEIHKGYAKDDRELFVLGVDKTAAHGDFGAKLEYYHPPKTGNAFLKAAKHANIDGVFVGHCHKLNTCIFDEGIRWVFGLKTGQYDYHEIGQLGGTLITLCGSDFSVTHVPAMVPLAPYPSHAPMLSKLFTKE